MIVRQTKRNLICRLWGDEMAGLDEKITIGIQYRPCIVHIPEERERIRNMSGKVTTKVIREVEQHKALFHCWDHRSELCDASPMIGGHPGGQVSCTFAIVEYEDGTVHEVEPQNIRFVDNAFFEYTFPEMEGKQ